MFTNQHRQTVEVLKDVVFCCHLSYHSAFLQPGKGNMYTVIENKQSAG